MTGLHAALAALVEEKSGAGPVRFGGGRSDALVFVEEIRALLAEHPAAPDMETAPTREAVEPPDQPTAGLPHGTPADLPVATDSTTAAHYTCPTRCVEQNHPGVEHDAWLGRQGEHHPKCYQSTGAIPDDLPADLCDCRVLRMIDQHVSTAWETHGPCRWGARGLPACNAGTRGVAWWCRPCLADRLAAAEQETAALRAQVAALHLVTDHKAVYLADERWVLVRDVRAALGDSAQVVQRIKDEAAAAAHAELLAKVQVVYDIHCPIGPESDYVGVGARAAHQWWQTVLGGLLDDERARRARDGGE